MLHLNSCHCSFPFHCCERMFLSLQIWPHQKQIAPWEAAGGVTPHWRSPYFAERGHYCLTFLLDWASPLPWAVQPVSPACPPCTTASAPCFPHPKKNIRGQRDLQNQNQSRAHFGVLLVSQLATQSSDIILMTLSIHILNLSICSTLIISLPIDLPSQDFTTLKKPLFL